MDLSFRLRIYSLSHVQQPVIPVHLAYRVSRSVIKVLVQELRLEHPVPVRSLLLFREHEALATVETVAHIATEDLAIRVARDGGSKHGAGDTRRLQ